MADEALTAFNRALEPKRLVLLPGGHFDAYVADFESASGEAAARFAEHQALAGGGRPPRRCCRRMT